MMKMKEASASLKVRILKLKEEQKALIDRGKKIRARELEAEALKQGIKVPWTRTQLAGAAKNRKAAEEVQPAGARKKRKKVVKTIVPQALVEYMILNPHNPLAGFREERLGKSPEWFRDFYDEQKALADQQILIGQYRTKGYAEDYTEVEVTDDEDGTEVTGVEDCTEVTGVEDCTDDKDI